MELLINLLKEITDISEFLKSEYGIHGNELSRRISEVNAYHARLPEIVATAEYILLAAKAQASEDILNASPEITATLLKIKIENRCKNEIKALRFAERLESTASHQLDGLRSQLSYLKSLNDT